MKITLRIRILGLSLIPLILFAYPLLVHFPSQFADSARAGTEGKLRSLSSLLGHSLGPDLDQLAREGAPEALGKRIAGLEADSDRVSVAIYDLDGKYLAGLRVNANTAPDPRALLGDEPSRMIRREESIRLVSRIHTSAGQQRLVGYLLLEASLAQANALESEQRTMAVLLGLLSLLLGVGLALYLASRILKSLQQATELATEVALGNLGLQLPEATGEGDLDVMLASLGDMVRGLRSLQEQAEAIARGDLTLQTTGSGDLHTAFREMLERQRELVHTLSETTTELETSSHEILATLRDQEAGANDQASAVEEARRTMESLLEASSRITSAAQTVHTNAQRARESSAETAERAGQLNQLTARIADVLTGITKIADRSDILALNAALEGTKAGEAGKGFILVAEEMRRLAENVLESVRDISELVEAIRQASQASVLATEEGVKLSQETTNSAEQIRMTARQQQTGTQMATQSMNEVSEILTQGVTGARQTTAAVEDLSQRATNLRDVLAQYVLEEREG